MAALTLLALLAGAAAPSRADITVTLGTRTFAAHSPAAPLHEAFDEARRRAAATTGAWSSSPDDLAAWGPALIFPLLGSGLPSDTVVALASSLEAKDVAPLLVWRTLGLYAAKSRVPFDDTAAMRAAVDRNLEKINRAAGDIHTFAAARDLAELGPTGLGAWVAYLDLLYREYWNLGDPGARAWNGTGLELIDDLLTRAPLPDGKGFRFAADQDGLTLWPNALMLYALNQAYENEEAVRYESAALDTAAAVEALRDKDGAYFSTAEHSDKSPRANAYLAGALLLLAKNTGDESYRHRALGILHWLASNANAALLARDAGLEAHLGYLLVLADSLATQPMENILGRRPMRDSVAEPPELPLDELRPADFRYRAMFDGVLDTLMNHLPSEQGDFAYDYGDAPGYATNVLLAAHQNEAAAAVLQREQKLLGWPRPRNFDEISFGATAFFAALAQPDAFPPERAEAALRRYVLLSGTFAIADRYYMDWVDWFTGGGGYDYGPTVIGAQIAESQLLFAQTFPQQRVGWLVDPAAVGRALVDTAGRQVWDDAAHVYRARPGSDEVWLLPNAMMILALLQTRTVTGDAAYLERAEAVASGLDPLWDDKRGAYSASSTQIGADGYLSLSTNSYAALAFHRLAAATGKQPFEERAQSILDFIQRDLYSDGVIYHHVYRGRRAAGDIWCSGCNWRVLSILREVAAPAQAPPATSTAPG